MKIYHPFLVSFFTTLLWCGCGDSSTQQKQQLQTSTFDSTYMRFFPLQVGNYWLYCNEYNTLDTIKRSEVIGTTSKLGFNYFVIEQKYFKGKKEKDTLYLRFDTTGILRSYLGGKDSAYIDFLHHGPTSYYQIYPGMINAFPSRDSLPIGGIDTCIDIAFGRTEPFFKSYVKDLGEIRYYDVVARLLMKAKIGDRVYE